MKITTRVHGTYVFPNALVEQGTELSLGTGKVWELDGRVYVNVSDHIDTPADASYTRIGTLLSIDRSNPKLAKSAKKFAGTVSYVQYLAPFTLSGRNVCSHASTGCANACLYTAGRGRTSPVQVCRIARTLYYLSARAHYLKTLQTEIDNADRLARRKGKRIAVRLNGTSDLNWNAVIDGNPHVQFYDYTKNPSRANDSRIRLNYDVTFSRSEWNQVFAFQALSAGVNAAFVFSSEAYQRVVNRGHYAGFPVVDGDAHDLRLREVDGEGVIVALKAKGEAKADASGFVIA